MPGQAATKRAWFGVTASLGSFTLAARSSELLPGERRLAAAARTVEGSPTGTVAHWLDVGLNDDRALVVFAALGLAIAVRWGSHALFLWCCAGGATALTKIVDLVQRPRPTPDLRWGEYLPGYGGFPSGHVVYVTLLAATAAGLARTHESSPVVRRTIAIAAVALGLAIGPARMVTNDHWAGDVVAGYLLAGWFLLSGSLLRPVLDEAYSLGRAMLSRPNARQGDGPLHQVAERRRRRALRA